MTNPGKIVNSHTVQFERILPGPIEQVWESISTREGVERWHRCMGDFAIELQKGGRFSCKIGQPAPSSEVTNAEMLELFASMPAIPSGGMINTPRGLVIESSPPLVLEYSFIDPTCDLITRIRFELKPVGDEVLLILTHCDLPADMMIAVAAGWHAHLDALVAVLRGETPEDFLKSFLQNSKLYSSLIAASLVVSASTAPVLANSDNNAHKILTERRAQLLNKYDVVWKEADQLKYQVSLAARDRSNDAQRTENDLEKELTHKYDELHKLELDMRDLDKSLI